MPSRKTYPTAKPYPTFPLTPRRDGRFVKKIHGQQFVFGAGGDWKAAFAEYTRQAHALHAGRQPPTAVAEIVTVRQIANKYLDARNADVRAGTLHMGSWGHYRAALSRFVKFVGAGTPAASLSTGDFARFAEHLRKLLGSYAYNRNRALLSAWLRYAAKAEWVMPINIGVGFPKVSAGKIRGERKKKLFTPIEVRTLLDIARGQMRAMILLGLNAGFGATDCANLTKDKIDLPGGVIRYNRTKTNIARTAPLWPETVAALAPLLLLRPDDPHVFRTNHGKLWVRVERKGKKIITKDSVGDRFGRLMESVCMLGMKVRDTFKKQRPGLGFYALRHTFYTYANEVRDSDARLHLMGRRLPSIDGDAYLEGLFLPRLKVVTDHVRSRLLDD